MHVCAQPIPTSGHSVTMHTLSVKLYRPAFYMSVKLRTLYHLFHFLYYIIFLGAAPLNVNVTLRRPTALGFTWDLPPPELSGSLSAFQIEFGLLGSRDRVVMSVDKGGQRLYSPRVQLEEDSTYQFIVRGLYDGGVVGVDAVVITTTLEDGMYLSVLHYVYLVFNYKLTFLAFTSTYKFSSPFDPPLSPPCLPPLLSPSPSPPPPSTTLSHLKLHQLLPRTLL